MLEAILPGYPSRNAAGSEESTTAALRFYFGDPPFLQFVRRLCGLGCRWIRGCRDETYACRSSVVTAEQAEQIRKEFPQAVALTSLRREGEDAILYEAVWDNNFLCSAVGGMTRRLRFKGEHGELRALPTRMFRQCSQSRKSSCGAPAGGAE